MATNKKLIAQILHAARRLTVSRDALLAGFGMTSAKLRLLKTVHRLPVRFTTSALARAMNVSRQAARLIVRELESAGLISTATDPRNRKAQRVALTTSGRAQLEELLRVEKRWVADITRGFDERLLAQTEWVIRIVRERVDT
jgi:DNA-binding MarR family transcriptional regulator